MRAVGGYGKSTMEYSFLYAKCHWEGLNIATMRFEMDVRLMVGLEVSSKLYKKTGSGMAGR